MLSKSATKRWSIIIAILLSSGLLRAQTDSVHSLFDKPHVKLPFKYSFLQWDIGYTGFFFQDGYINGFRSDIIGAVFNNDLDLSLGFATSLNGYNFGVSSTDPYIHSYAEIYFKAEPMLFPDKLFNLSVPILFSYSAFTYSIGSSPYGYQRRRRIPSASFPSISGGLNLMLNLYKRMSIGAGAAYRFGFDNNSTSTFGKDYSNFIVNVFLRIRINTHALHGYLLPDKNDYYKPQ